MAFVTQFAAVTVIGPFAEVFDQMGLLLFVMGALGGLTAHFAVRLPFKTAFWPALVGGLLGFGLALVAPPILKSMLGVELMIEGGSARGMAACAYLVGVLHERVLKWLRGDTPNAE